MRVGAGAFCFAMPYEIRKREDGKHCIYKIEGGDTLGCHDTEKQAKDQIAAIGARTHMSMYLLDKFVITTPGQPIRLFPFGQLVKDGKTRIIDRALALKFRLPHFKPPIKLGSHEEATPAGGHFLNLFVGDDGLYGTPEFTERGALALAEGAYRYHSPEVIWEDGWIEDPTTGNRIPGPLIVGDALLHTPHLGESAALYTVTKGQNNMSETVSIPTGMWDQFMGWFKRISEPPEIVSTETLPPVPEEFKAAMKERDDLKAQVATMQTAQALAARVQKFEADVAQTKAGREGLAELLAGMTDEQATRIMQELKALSAQIDESAVTGEKGSAGTGTATDDPSAAFDAAVKAKAAELKLTYPEAFAIVAREQPDLLTAYARKEK